MNKTKIIATIGPSTKSKERIKELILNGVDVIRINLSHADYNFCLDIMQKIKEISKELHTQIGIMLDLNGPDVRIGSIEEEITVEKNELINIHMKEIEGDKNNLSVNYPNLINDLKYNSLIKVGKSVVLKVVDKKDYTLICQVLIGGKINPRESIFAPDDKINIDFISNKDKQDILFAIKNNVDFLALSFVSNKDNVLEVNKILNEHENYNMQIISKIENIEGYKNIDEILEVSDGIIVARGDLSSNIKMEKIPTVTKNILTRCHLYGKVGIVATDLLASMVKNNYPTSSEVSDITIAVENLTDALLLSDETAKGLYPIESVKTLTKILSEAEKNIDHKRIIELLEKIETKNTLDNLANSSVKIADSIKAKAIIVSTSSGYTAKRINRYRPETLVIAITPNKETVKSLTLNFGIYPVLTNELRTFDAVIKEAKDIMNDNFEIKEGEKIVIVCGYPHKDAKSANLIEIEQL